MISTVMRIAWLEPPPRPGRAGHDLRAADRLLLDLRARVRQPGPPEHPPAAGRGGGRGRERGEPRLRERPRQGGRVAARRDGAAAPGTTKRRRASPRPGARGSDGAGRRPADGARAAFGLRQSARELRAAGPRAAPRRPIGPDRRPAAPGPAAEDRRHSAARPARTPRARDVREARRHHDEGAARGGGPLAAPAPRPATHLPSRAPAARSSPWRPRLSRAAAGRTRR